MSARIARPYGKAPIPVREDHLTWCRATVEGRPVVYGVGGGEGPPVVFLHGWALGCHAYKRAIRRLTNRGCRVFAPALPSFGGTADLPHDSMDISGYARWVVSFMTEVGIEEPALVIGHSFGGGVAIKLARDNPELVRYLILLNPLGAGKRRPPWEWAIGFGIEFLPLSTALDLVQAIRSDLVPNLLQNPLGVLRAGLLAMGTDLRTEMSQLKQLGVPVLALTSERDRLIPRNAFETVCDTVGADGRVVRGGHAWLLVDPDLFGEVLASTIDVQVEEHEVARAADRKKEIYRLLKRSHLSKRDIDSLLASAAPLWLLSEAAPTLAGDLVLCRPALRKNEVRALAHRIQDSDSLRLTIVARDRPGLLADSAAVLAASGLAISNASASTWQRPNVALHSFIVDSDGDLSDEAWDALGARLRKMVSAGKAPSPPLRPLRPVRVTVEGVADQSMVKVVAPDQTGLLSAVCRHFQTHGVNIQTLRARTRDGFAHGTFVVLGEVDAVELSEYLERGATAANPSGRKLTLLPPRKESA